MDVYETDVYWMVAAVVLADDVYDFADDDADTD